MQITGTAFFFGFLDLWAPVISENRTFFRFKNELWSLAFGFDYFEFGILLTESLMESWLNHVIVDLWNIWYGYGRFWGILLLLGTLIFVSPESSRKGYTLVKSWTIITWLEQLTQAILVCSSDKLERWSLLVSNMVWLREICSSQSQILYLFAFFENI